MKEKWKTPEYTPSQEQQLANENDERRQSRSLHAKDLACNGISIWEWQKHKTAIAEIDAFPDDYKKPTFKEMLKGMHLRGIELGQNIRCHENAIQWNEANDGDLCTTKLRECICECQYCQDERGDLNQYEHRVFTS